MIPGRNNKKILLIDNDESSCLLIQEILADYNIEVNFAKDGKSAIQLFETENNIGLVISDMKLPDISGFEILNRFIKINPLIPILAWTASLHNNMKKKCLNSGFSEFFEKPLDIDFFLGTLKKYFE